MLINKALYLPFAVMDLWVGWLCYVAARASDYRMACVFGIAALSFSGIIAGYYLTPALERREKAEHLLGRKSEISNSNFLSWAIAWFFNGVTMLMLIVTFDWHPHDKMDSLIFDLIIFTTLGFLSTMFAFWKLWQLARFGVAAMQVRGRVEVGGILEAAILLHRSLIGAEEAFLDLLCERHLNREKDASKEVLWEEHQKVSIPHSFPGLPTRISFRFKLPSEMPPSHGDDGVPEAVYWILKVRVPVQGPDYSDQFSVKVRRPKNQRPQ